MYVALNFICIGWFELCVGHAKKIENYKMKNSCPKRDSNPLSLALLDWRSNRLCYRVVLTVDIYRLIYTYSNMYSKKFNQKLINFKFHFIIYPDLNVIAISKRFPTIKIYFDVCTGAWNGHRNETITRWYVKIILIASPPCLCSAPRKPVSFRNLHIIIYRFIFSHVIFHVII